ncbi:MAG: hypothetical protein ABEI97_05105, partial [Candidatus Nanohaloarchaea archaeon]
VVTNSRSMRRKRMAAAAGQSLADSEERIEREIDERWEVEDRRFDENFVYLILREREGPYSSNFWHQIDMFDVFAYEPLLEYTYSLPMEQKKNRRLMKQIAEGRIPERVISEGPSGAVFVARMIQQRIAANADRYRETIESLLSRGHLDESVARKYLLPDVENIAGREMDPGHVFYMATMFLFEQWLRAFDDSEEPWTSPV